MLLLRLGQCGLYTARLKSHQYSNLAVRQVTHVVVNSDHYRTNIYNNILW